MGERLRTGDGGARHGEWTVPAADVRAGADEVARLVHRSLPELAWGRRSGSAWVVGPVAPPRPLVPEPSDAEYAGFLVRLAGLLSFLGAHGLGLGEDAVATLGARPGSRDVPWLAAPPVPAWRALPATRVLGGVALRLAGRAPAAGRGADGRRELEDALSGGLPPRSAEAVAALLRAADAARPSEALLIDLAGTGDVGERVALDLLGLALPRDVEARGARAFAAGAAADWVARGAARRAPGEVAFAEAGPPRSVEDGAPFRELADALGPDPRAAVLRALARGEAPPAEDGPPLVLLAREVDRWDALSAEAWDRLPRFLPGVERVETRAGAPPPWLGGSLLVPRLSREEIAGLVHLPLAAPPAFSRLWEGLEADSGGDPARLLRAARERARAFLPGSERAVARRRAAGTADLVVRASALLGGGFDVAEASAASGASPERSLEALEEAADAGLLVRSASDAWRFADGEARRKVAASLSAAERAAALARVAAAGVSPLRLLLARLGGAPSAEDVEEARRRLVGAFGRRDAAEAASLLERAPASSPDYGEPLLVFEALAAAGRMEEARALAARLDAAAVRAEPLRRREAVAALLGRLGLGEAALALLPPEDVDEGRLARAALLLKLRRVEEAAALLDDAGPASGPLAARIRLLRAELHERRGELAEAERELRAVGGLLASPSDDPSPVDTVFTAAWLALDLKRPREARAFLRAARDGARDPSRRADALFDLSVAAAEDGDLAEAEASLAEALALFTATGERDRYLGALGQRAAFALLRDDARAALRDLRTVLAHDRAPGRAFQLLFALPLRQRLALADGDDADAAEAYQEAAAARAEAPDHPAWREVLVLEGARLLAAGLAEEALARLAEAEPLSDARSGVEPLRARLVASALVDLGRGGPPPPALEAAERALLRAEAALARGQAPAAEARQALAELLERPGGAVTVATRILEWRGRFPAFLLAPGCGPVRELGLRAARRAGLEGAAARFAVSPAPAPAPTALEAPAAGALVAEDAATREALEKVRRVAPSRLSVLVLGESGTGKELLAREVHRASGRSGPFLAVNVAAFPETLAEAELFGAARGAFTGADRDRPGVLEASSGGTLFLDEIGDLSPALQAKLLRVFQEREVRRLGETKTRPVDLRLVSATHRDLPGLAAEGRFRADLLYRIAGLSVTLPPLRERPRDLRALLERALGGTPVAPEARAALLSWGWPGNVRELLSAVELAKAMAGPGARVEREHLPAALRAAPAAGGRGKGRYRDAVDAAKRKVVLETLAETAGNRTRAAELLGLSRQSLLYEMKRLGLREPKGPAR